MIPQATCPKCSYTWAIRTERPKRCPACGLRDPLKEEEDK